MGRKPKAVRESDRPILLGDGNADHMGKGPAGTRSRRREHAPDMKGWDRRANLKTGNSNDDGSECS